jgi:hypothetical protein
MSSKLFLEYKKQQENKFLNKINKTKIKVVFFLAQETQYSEVKTKISFLPPNHLHFIFTLPCFIYFFLLFEIFI